MVGISSKFPSGRPFHAQTQVEHVIVKPVMICTHARSWLRQHEQVELPVQSNLS